MHEFRVELPDGRVFFTRSPLDIIGAVASCYQNRWYLEQWLVNHADIPLITIKINERWSHRCKPCVPDKIEVLPVTTLSMAAAAEARQKRDTAFEKKWGGS